MKFKRPSAQKTIPIFIVLLLSGCQSLKTSRVMPSENRSYVITALVNPFKGEIEKANEISYIKAQEYCEAQSSEAIFISSQNTYIPDKVLIAQTQPTTPKVAFIYRFRCDK